MKKKLSFLCFLLCSFTFYAQDNLEDLLTAGVEDAQTFSSSYIEPASKALIHSSANGWIQEAQVKKILRFDISVVANISPISNNQKSFTLNTADYNSLRFKDGSSSKEVANIFGENTSDITMTADIINENGDPETIEFNLPQGLGSTGVSFVPTAFLHGRVGVFKATELKVRFFPKVKMEDVSLGIFGIGVQHEISKWFADKFPIAISGLIAYNNMGASYKFDDDQIVEGVDAKFKLKQNAMLYQLQASTKMKILNFYGGIGYISGTSNFDVLGTYEIVGGTPATEGQNVFYNPISLKHKVSGMRGTLGAKLKLGFFKLHADYSFSEFNTITAGLHFGI